MNRNRDQLSDSDDHQIFVLKDLLEFLEDEIEKDNQEQESRKTVLKITNFLNFSHSPAGQSIPEIFEGKLDEAKTKITIILHSLYPIVLKQNRLLLKEMIQSFRVLTQTSNILLKGKIFDVLKNLCSFQQSISCLKIEEVSIKFGKIIQIVKKLSLQSFHFSEYQRRVFQKNKGETFSDRVLQIKKKDSSHSDSVEKGNQIDQKLMHKIQSQITQKNLDQYLKTRSSTYENLEIPSQICRICLLIIHVNDLKIHVKNCSERYKTNAYLEQVRNEIISLRSEMKRRQIQFESSLKKSNQLSQNFGDDQTATLIFKVLLRDIDNRCERNYHTRSRERKIQNKDIQNLLNEETQLIHSQPLLLKYFNFFMEEKSLILRISKLEIQRYKNSQTDSRNSKHSIRMSLDSFVIKTPQKNNKKSKFAIAKKKTEEHKRKTACYLSERVTKFPLLRKHSSQKFIRNRQQDLTLKNFQVLRLLGKGAFGRVYLVRRISTKDLYAMKVIPMETTQYNLVKNQHDIFGKISGDHLVRAVFSFTEGNVHMFFLEFMNGGDFAELLEKQIYFQENVAKYYFAQIALAIQKLHETGIIHRDIKPSNLVLDSNGYIKLTDFGLSKLGIRHVISHSQQISKVYEAASQIIESSSLAISPLIRKLSHQKKTLLGYNANLKRRIIGTPDYIAPEIIKQQSFDNPSIDWWSFGVLVYEALIGQKPFGAQKIDDVFQNILNLKIIWPQIGHEDGMITPQAQDFIKKLLQPDYNKRLGFKGIQQVRAHPFWNEFNWQDIKQTSPPIKGESQDLSCLEEIPELRKQIEDMINKQGSFGSHSKLKRLVRLDVLSEYTLSRAELSSKESKDKTRSIRKSSITAIQQSQ